MADKLNTDQEKIVPETIENVRLDNSQEDAEIEKILLELDDTKLFPGISGFSRDRLKNTTIPDIQEKILKINRNSIISSLSADQEEEAILRKYSNYGSLSTFKGRLEMKEFRRSLAIKKGMRLIKTTLGEKEAIVDSTKENLRHYKVTLTDLTFFKDQESHSLRELEKIEKELCQVLKDHGYKPRINNHCLNLPDDTNMLSKQKVRQLIEHHALHLDLYAESKSKVPGLEQKLQKSRQELEEVFSKEAALGLLIKLIRKKDVATFEELNVVAKHRWIAYELKNKALNNQWKRENQRIIDEKERKLKLQIEMEKLNQDRSEKMAKFLKESTILEKKRNDMIALPKQINEKKERALEELSHHLIELKQEYLKNRKQKKSTPGKEKRTIDSKKMKILSRVLDQQAEKVSKKIHQQFNVKKVQFSQSKVKDELVDEQQSEEEVKLKLEIPEPSLFRDLERDPSPVALAPAKRFIPLLRVKPLNPIKEMNTKPAAKIFKIDPPSLDFKDAVPNRTYTQSIRIINTTSSPKSFKFLRFSPNIEDCASITISQSRSLCSGAECAAQIHLTPSPELLEQHSDSTFMEFQSSCGTIFEVPLRYSTARCHPVICSVGGTNVLTTDFSRPSGGPCIVEKQISSTFAKLVSENLMKLSFEPCVVGDKRKAWIKITNDGSIPTEFFVKTKESSLYQPENAFLGIDPKIFLTEDTFAEGPFVVRHAAGALGSYASRVISITFEPVYDAEQSRSAYNEVKVHASFVIRFKNADPIVIECTGRSKDLTLQPEREVVDLKTCLPSIFYQDSVRIWNHHKISRRFRIESSPYKSFLHGEARVITIPEIGTIELSPSVGLIQPNSNILVCIKVKFFPTAIEKLEGFGGKFISTINFGYLEQATGKERFAPLTIQAIISDNKISVTTENGGQELDFESLSIFERKRIPIRIKNASKFSQIIQCSASEIFHTPMTPGDLDSNVFKIAPETTITRYISFEPVKAVQYKEAICFKTTWNQDVFITCIGTGYSPFAHFDLSLVGFPLIPFENHLVKRVTLQKNKSHNLSFEFQKPILLSVSSNNGPGLTLNNISENQIIPLTDQDKDMLNIWPNSGILSEKSAVIEIMAQAPARRVPWEPLNLNSVPSKGRLDPIKQVGKKEGIAKLEEAPTALDAIELEPYVETAYQSAIYNTANPVVSWLVPCILKPVQTEEDCLNGLLKGNNSEPDFDPESKVIYLKVMVPISESKILIIQPENDICDFGTLAVGKKEKRTIIIQNISSSIIEIGLQGISPFGPFHLINSKQSIHAGDKIEVAVYFKPEKQTKFSNAIDFMVGSRRKRIRLIGEGIIPSLKVDHENIFMGDICVGDHSVAEVEITNTSKVTASCIFSILSSNRQKELEVGSFNYANKSPFSISEFRCIIQQGESKKLSVRFSPDREHDNFFDFLLVHSEGQKNPYLVKLSGNGWESSPVILHYNEHPTSFQAPAHSFPLRHEYDFTSGHILSMAGIEGSMLSLSNSTNSKGKKEEAPALEALLLCPKRAAHFVTISLDWAQISGTELLPTYPGLRADNLYWRIQSRDIELANLCPFEKVEPYRKMPPTEFKIEKINTSFEYENNIKEYYLAPPMHSENIGFVIELEPSFGTIDSGTSKLIKILITDPTRKILHASQNTWTKLDNPEVERSVLSSSSVLKRNQTNILTCAIDIDHNQALALRQKALDLEISKPIYFEQVFKITFKSGTRFVEPGRGPLPADESSSKVFFLKLVANTD